MDAATEHNMKAILKGTIRSTRAGVALISAASFLASAQAGAQTFSEDFSAGNDDAFTHYDPVAGTIGPRGSWTVESGAYHIQASSTVPFNGLVGPTRAGSLVTGVDAGNFDATFDLSTFNKDLPQFVGLGARLSDQGLGTTDGYVFGYDNSFGGLFISKVTDEQVSGVIAFTPLTLDPAKSYHFTFSAAGPSLSGTVAESAPGSALLGNISGTDATYSSGSVGFIIADNSTDGSFGADATFDNLTVTQVPEPAHLALFSGLFFLAAGAFRRFRK